MASLTAALPILTALVGSGGFTVGIYSFVSPVSAAHIYGIPVSPSPRKDGPSGGVAATLSKDEAYVYAHGSRNLAIGTSILGLTAFWRFSSVCHVSPIAAQAVKICVGTTVLAGSMVPVVDAYVISQHVNRSNLSLEDAQRGRKASKAHALRALLWVAVAVTCLVT